MAEVDITTAASWDLIFVGAPCHMGDLSKKSQEFLLAMAPRPSCKIAGFITHAASLYHEDDYKTCFKSLEKMCDTKDLRFMGCYNCQGYLNPQIHGLVKKAKNISDAEWDKRVAAMLGHPDEADLANAQIFARNILAKA